MNLCRMFASAVLQNTGAIHHRIDALKGMSPIFGGQGLGHIDYDCLVPIASIRLASRRTDDVASLGNQACANYRAN